MGERSRNFKGVRINCDGDTAEDSSRRFVSVDVPRAHPLFMLEGDDPLDLPLYLDDNWTVYRYKGYKDATAPEAQNQLGKLLQMAIDNLQTVDRSVLRSQSPDWGQVPEWRQRSTTGSLLVSRTK